MRVQASIAITFFGLEHDALTNKHFELASLCCTSSLIKIIVNMNSRLTRPAVILKSVYSPGSFTEVRVVSAELLDAEVRQLSVSSPLLAL